MKVTLFVILVVFGVGCSYIERTTTAQLGEQPMLAVQTKTEKTLRSLPPPEQIITVSVYAYNDHTGQHKPSDIAEYSRAVTQDGLSMLKKALLDAGNQKWFRVLERGGLDHLLQERKIIRATRQSYRTSEGGKLPDLGPLFYAGVLLEGGIVAYESNVLTGGLGARYLGVGGSTEYRRDVVTVYLRAVSVKTGEVLTAVNASKTIFSTGMSGGVFKYVSFDEILEGEAGFTVNEPPQLGVRQAIEMAVYALIMEGAAENLWRFKDPAAGHAAMEQYLARVGERSPSTAGSHHAVSAASREELSSQATSRNVSLPARPPKISLPASPPQPRSQQFAVEKAKSSVGTSGQLPEGWYVQVAAVARFEGKDDRLFQELTQAQWPVKIQQARVRDQLYYRILVGPYPFRHVADNNLLLVRRVTFGREKAFVRYLQ